MSVALLFSAQGSQVVGMGRALAEFSPGARAAFDEADATLGWSVSRLAWEGPAELLDDTRQTQPCLVATSVACLRAFEEALASRGERLEPAYVAGHSVGEYAALVAASVLSLADALRLVARRGALMADAGVAGGMVAVIGLDRETVSAAVEATAREIGADGDPVVANDNAPAQVVISGTAAALTAAAERLMAAGARRAIPLNVSGPFHSPKMAPVGATLANDFASAAWRDAEIPLVSNVTAEPLTDAAQIRGLLARQVSSPVEWVRSVQRMAAEGVDTFVECGPGGALVGMVRRIVPQARCLTVSDPADLGTTVEALVGAAAAVPA
ncbi:MAG: ACP S-malonyltransferase [Chloroflexota bacterium]|nr:ACP S-malonyltransferase [Chloroflexota bacterium]